MDEQNSRDEMVSKLRRRAVLNYMLLPLLFSTVYIYSAILNIFNLL